METVYDGELSEQYTRFTSQKRILCLPHAFP